jgi:type II secretory pathway pseudopilin PulG
VRPQLIQPSVRDAGFTTVELVAVVAVAVVLASVTIPLSATAVDQGRVRTAASFMASRFRLARVEAVNSSGNVGVVFDLVNGSWQIRACRDGTGNGLRRADITSGADPCFDGPYDFNAMFPGVDIAVDPLLIGPAGEPGNPDPVRFGVPDIASFSATGSCTSGSLFLRSTKGQQLAVRISGANGRLRVFRYDRIPRVWVQF